MGLPIGFVTRIDGGVQEITHATGDHQLIQPGETCPLERAYCRRTIELESPLAVADVAGSDAILDEAIETFDLAAYLGSRIIVDDEVYGPVCFADQDDRSTAFSDGDEYLVELCSKLIGHGIERRGYERTLRERESELAERAETYRAVIDASFGLVFRIDSRGQFSYVSPTIESLNGYRAERYFGEPYVAMLPVQQTVELAAELYEAVLTGETIEVYYFPIEHRTDDRVLVAVRVTPIFASEVRPEARTEADIVGVQGMARDATKRYRRERIIRVLNRVLRYNLGNDMNVISGYADLLRERVGSDDAHLADQIMETSTRLVNLSDTARKLEQHLQARPNISPTEVVQVLDRTLEQIRAEYPAVSIKLDAPDTVLAAAGPRLETAVWEVLENAAKHGGEQPRIELTLTADDGSVRLRVEDDGPGLPGQERAILLAGDESPLVHGSGLGLWLIHWMVESLDGRRNLLDAENGTSLEMVLPSAE